MPALLSERRKTDDIFAVYFYKKGSFRNAKAMVAMMKETDIRRYAGLMRELGLTGLEITEDNRVVRLERTAAAENRPAIVPETDPADSAEEKNTGYCRGVLRCAGRKCRIVCVDRRPGKKGTDALHH